MDLAIYNHIDFNLKPNKNKIPINHFTFEQIDEFNKIYFYARDNFICVNPTKSKGISIKSDQKYHERYFVSKGNQRFELVIICKSGCYRFLLHNKKAEDNSITGQQSCRSMYKWADNFSIDMNKYATDNGLEEKKKIESPHIKMLSPVLKCINTPSVYHIDFRSSYASRICEAYPELKPMYDCIFAHRKENDGYYKHVLTNSIGAWQSEYCVDYNNRHATKPYQFANLSRIAINGTRAKVEDMIAKLERAGKRPLLTNTDGIWYYSENGPYHDSDEGDNLCNWQTDHKECMFLMVSSGAYQYVEDGVCHTVVRGICKLDAIEPDRTKWKFGDIKNITEFIVYKFDLEKGVYKTYE